MSSSLACRFDSYGADTDVVPATRGGVALSQWRVYACDYADPPKCRVSSWRGVP